MYYVYVIRCTDNSLYTGTASNLVKRLEEHFGGSDRRAKYTKSHTALCLEAAWECLSRSDALKMEYHLKQLSKSAKETLIKNNIASPSITLKLEGMIFKRLDIKDLSF